MFDFSFATANEFCYLLAIKQWTNEWTFAGYVRAAMQRQFLYAVAR